MNVCTWIDEYLVHVLKCVVFFPQQDMCLWQLSWKSNLRNSGESTKPEAYSRPLWNLTPEWSNKHASRKFYCQWNNSSTQALVLLKYHGHHFLLSGCICVGRVHSPPLWRAHWMVGRDDPLAAVWQSGCQHIQQGACWGVENPKKWHLTPPVHLSFMWKEAIFMSIKCTVACDSLCCHDVFAPNTKFNYSKKLKFTCIVRVDCLLESLQCWILLCEYYFFWVYWIYRSSQTFVLERGAGWRGWIYHSWCVDRSLQPAPECKTRADQVKINLLGSVLQTRQSLHVIYTPLMSRAHNSFSHQSNHEIVIA